MKTKPTIALVAGVMLLTALTGSGKAIPISIDGTISFSRSSKNTDISLEESANLINFGTVTGRDAGTLSGDSTGTTRATVVVKPSSSGHAGASAPIKPLKSFKSLGKKQGSGSVDSLSPSSWVLSGFGTASISRQALEKQETSKPGISSGQTRGKSRFTFPPTTIIPQPAAHNVPDGGATALLLGFSLCGIGWLKRKCAA